jgi:hypothetical protein
VPVGRAENGLARSTALPLAHRIRHRYFVDLVAVLVDDADEPAAPIEPGHGRAVAKVGRERDRVLAGGGGAGQVDAPMVVERLFAVGEAKELAGHR